MFYHGRRISGLNCFRGQPFADQCYYPIPGTTEWIWIYLLGQRFVHLSQLPHPSQLLLLSPLLLLSHLQQLGNTQLELTDYLIIMDLEEMSAKWSLPLSLLNYYHL